VCSSDLNGNFVPNTNLNQAGGNSSGQGGSNCNTSSTGLPQMTTDEKAQLYNPYQQNTATTLLQGCETSFKALATSGQSQID
jgi:hypothetical protein